MAVSRRSNAPDLAALFAPQGSAAVLRFHDPQVDIHRVSAILQRVKLATAGNDRPLPITALRTVAAEAYHAIRGTDRVSWRQRIACWRRGFFANKAYMYDFGRHGYDDFVSDFERNVRSDSLNGSFTYMLGDKFVAHHVLGGSGAPTPKLLDVLAPTQLSRLEELAREHHIVITKPRKGSGGAGVRKIAFEAGTYDVNGRRMPGLASMPLGEHTLVFEFMRQGRYAQEMFSESTNTVRIVTLVPEHGSALIACAVQRIGTTRSAPVDNFGAGGLSAGIDVATGMIGPGAAKPVNGRMSWHERHPESGAQIAGVVIPNWPSIAGEMLALAARLPGIRYAGWDVVVTDDGFSIIEGNNRPDVDLMQIHGPILLDARVRDFYVSRGVRRPSSRSSSGGRASPPSR